MEGIPALLQEPVTLQVESVDRVYLNGYVPKLQYPGGVYHWLREVRGFPIPSPAILGKIGDGYVHDVERYAKHNGIPLEKFPKGVRKEQHVRPLFERAMAEGRTGVVFIGAPNTPAPTTPSTACCATPLGARASCGTSSPFRSSGCVRMPSRWVCWLTTPSSIRPAPRSRMRGASATHSVPRLASVSTPSDSTWSSPASARVHRSSPNPCRWR